MTANDYANPDVLVSTDWVAEHLHDPTVRIVESNEDALLYPAGHIAGAVYLDWIEGLNDSLQHNSLQQAMFEKLMSSIGVTPDMTVVFYGDRNNVWATYALWVFQLFDHRNVKIMDGGRRKWLTESRPLSKEVPQYPATQYQVSARPNAPIRAFRHDVQSHCNSGDQLIDVRSPREFRGESLYMPSYPFESARSSDHIPSAKNIPWRSAVAADGTFKSAADLRAIYEGQMELTPSQPTITYCHMGERSSHTWFVLTYLLGYLNVRNYDGKWREPNDLVGVSIET